jgi:hypothetical protein
MVHCTSGDQVGSAESDDDIDDPADENFEEFMLMIVEDTAEGGLNAQDALSGEPLWRR